MSDLVAALRAAGVRDVVADQPLAAATTLKVGGPAAAFVRADSAADLAAVATVCAQLGRPWLIVGRGSNLLVADEGWPGVAVMLGRAFRGVDAPDRDAPVGTPVTVAVGAAEPMPVLANTLAGWGLEGLAFGVAIPGSVGGAVRMNAGAHGAQMRDVLVDVQVARLGAGGRPERLDADALAMTYRHTELPPDAVVVRATLRLRRADADELARQMSEMRRWRREHQPINEPSCGSVFRNPTGDSAGRLIEAAGLKGYRVGGAQVSPVHANFITVTPAATAADVFGVISHARAVVRDRFGVTLQTEVVLAGFDQPVTAGEGA